jgi:hypothetical protein
MKILKNDKVFFFVCGVAAAFVGKAFLKSKAAHKWAVQGMASGMKMQKDALEKLQNIKEEATDLYLDSLKEADNG